jgi:hypothetical protein
MKVRNGFVSNSSSSSFVIFGKIIDNKALQGLFKFTDDEMRDIDDNGMFDYEKRLNGLTFQYLGDGDWLIGSWLSGNGDDVINGVKDATLKLVSIHGDCELYKGIDQDGEISLE